MSLSTKTRLEDRTFVLQLMACQTEDIMIRAHRFSANDEDFERVYPTTWTELANDYLIESYNSKGPVDYRLRGSGWIAGLRFSDRWETESFRRKAGQLSQTLKRYIKATNRNDETAIVAFDTLCQESKLPDGFVYNAIESHLLRELYGTYDAEWDAGSKRHVVIPNRFGLPIL